MFDIFHWVLQGLRAVCLVSSVATARRDPKEIRERKKKSRHDARLRRMAVIRNRVLIWFGAAKEIETNEIKRSRITKKMEKKRKWKSCLTHTHQKKKKKNCTIQMNNSIFFDAREATISKGSTGSPRCYGSHHLWWIWKRLVQENGRGNVVCTEYFKEEPLFKKWKASKSLGRFDSKHDTEPREIILCPSQHLNSISACTVLHSLLSTHHAGYSATPTTRPWRPIWNIEYKPLINKKQSAATAASTAAERESQCLKGVALGIPKNRRRQQLRRMRAIILVFP